MDVIDIGCGRGDMVLYIAKKVKSSVGIDYSPDGIQIAKTIKKNYHPEIQKKTKFFVMNAHKLNFKDNSFDLVLLIDTLDHLEPQEQKQTLKEITRILRPGGELFIRTCANSIQLNYAYKFHTYPINKMLTWIDQKVKKVNYEPLSKDPRTQEQTFQHVNESNYFKLKRTLKQLNFRGKITSETGFIKEGTGLRTKLYNFTVAFHPLSEHFPLNILYGFSFSTRAKLLHK